MYKFLKVVGITDLKENSKGLKYVGVWVRPILMLPSGAEVFSNQPEKMRNVFGAHEDFKADPIFEDIVVNKTVKIGSLLQGSIQRFDTTEYQPEGYDKLICSATYVIFDNENAVQTANRQLKQNYACVIDSNTGETTAPEQLKRPLVLPTLE